MRDDYIEIPSLRYHIDTINVGKRSVFISGWVLDKGHVVAADSSDFTYRAFSDTPIIPKCFAYNIILRNTETNKFYKIKTFGVSRPDVTKHFNDGTTTHPGLMQNSIKLCCRIPEYMKSYWSTYFSITVSLNERC